MAIAMPLLPVNNSEKESRVSQFSQQSQKSANFRKGFKHTPQLGSDRFFAKYFSYLL